MNVERQRVVADENDDQTGGRDVPGKPVVLPPLEWNGIVPRCFAVHRTNDRVACVSTHFSSAGGFESVVAINVVGVDATESFVVENSDVGNAQRLREHAPEVDPAEVENMLVDEGFEPLETTAVEVDIGVSIPVSGMTVAATLAVAVDEDSGVRIDLTCGKTHDVTGTLLAFPEIRASVQSVPDTDLLIVSIRESEREPGYLVRHDHHRLIDLGATCQ